MIIGCIHGCNCEDNKPESKISQNSQQRTSTAAARKRYLAYAEAGISMGRRPELVGGGLIRRLGDWAEMKKIRLKEMARINGVAETVTEIYAIESDKTSKGRL